MKKFFLVRSFPGHMDKAFLFLRLVCGIAIAMHGWGKIQNPMAWMGPDAAVPGIFQLLAAISEFGGGIAWVLGLLTPLASLGIAITMAVAASMHAFVFGDPFVKMTAEGGSYEPAAMYFAIALVLLASGPGQLSLDRKIFGTKN